MSRVGGPVPALVLVRRAGRGCDELGGAVPQTVCCLRSTTAGTRAVVYRSAAEQGVIGVIDFVSGAVPQGRVGWEAAGVFRRIEPYLPRALLLADPVLATVFAHLHSRRRVPVEAGRRLVTLLPDLPFAAAPGVDGPGHQVVDRGAAEPEERLSDPAPQDLHDVARPA